MYRKTNRIGNFVKAIAIMLALITCGSLMACNKYVPGENVIESSEFGFTDGMFVCYMLKVSFEFTEEELEEHGYDDSLALDKQYYEGKTTWFDEIINRAISKATDIIIVCEMAKKEGVELSLDEKQSIESEFVKLRTEAVVAGNYTLDEYLELTYNYKVTESDLANMYTYETLATKYLETVYEECKREVKEEEISSFLDTYDQSILDHSITRDLCHILVPADQYDHNEDVMNEVADNLIKQIQEKGLNEENFISVAKEYSPNGTYVYEGLKKGDMIEEIDKWIYAKDRALGDIGKVYSDEYGVHIFYYSSDNREVCYFMALGEIVDERMDEWMADARKSFKVNVNKKAIYGLDVSR